LPSACTYLALAQSFLLAFFKKKLPSGRLSGQFILFKRNIFGKQIDKIIAFPLKIQQFMLKKQP
jgi:hypothetical protein